MRLKNFALPLGIKIFKSFSDESRVRIIHLLYQNGELSISDLVQILDFTQTKTSRHITFLKNAELVSARKEDQWVFYGIKEETYEIIDQIFDFLSKDVTLQKDQEVFETLHSNRALAVNKLEAKNYWR